MSEKNKMSFLISFIYKPVMAWVLNIVIIVVGMVCYNQLPVRLFPVVEDSTIYLETSYTDAGADVIESQITRPMEEGLMGVNGLKDISSTSTASNSNIFMTFHSWVNMSEVYTQILNRVSRARSMIDTGKIRLRDTQIEKNDPNSSTAMFLMIFGEGFSIAELGDAAARYVKTPLETMGGVATIEIFGGGAKSGNSTYNMDITVSPDRLHNVGLSIQEVIHGIKEQIYKVPFGMIDDGRYVRNVTLKSELNTPDSFARNIFFNTKNASGEKGYITLGQVADSIKLREDNKKFKVRYAKRSFDAKKKMYFNRSDAIAVGIVPQPKASPMQIDAGFKQERKEIERSLPKGMKLNVIDNVAEYIGASIQAVYRSLFEAILFVFLVIFFFLQSARATIVPMITIPICLIGGFTVMYIFNFSINLLTLLAMVLATGLVVDDAIVVLENIYKYIEKGYSKVEAAILGTKEIQFSIIAMTLTLAAVYAPIALTPGLVGNLFSEFAFTLTGTVLISGFTALVLSPMMCARMLPTHEELQKIHAKKTGLSYKITTFLNNIDKKYESLLKLITNYRGLIFGLSALLLICTFTLAKYGLPSLLSPAIDTGRFSIHIQVPSGIKMEELELHIRKVEKIVEGITEIDSYYTQLDMVGGRTRIDGYLKPGIACEAVLSKYSKDFDNVPLALSNVRPICKNLNLAGNASAYDFSLSVQSNKDYQELIKQGDRIARELALQPGVIKETIRFDKTDKIPAYSLIPDRYKAAKFGVNLQSLQDLTSIATGMAAGYFEKDSKKAEVYVKTSDEITLQEILRFDIRSTIMNNNTPSLIPLGELVTVERTAQKPAIPHQSGMRSFTIFAATDPNYGLDYIYNNFRDRIDASLPNGYRIQPLGSLKEFLSESNNIFFIIGLALVFIYLIMAAQFESFVDPLIIMGTVPLSWVGAIVLLYLLPKGSLNVFSGIGLLTLIGLITKHGILMVDFANKNLIAGQSIEASMINAAASRLRPILMTTLAMILGAAPLILSSGVGYEIRRQIGIVIVGGMSLGTIFTLFFIPCLYISIKKLRK